MEMDRRNLLAGGLAYVGVAGLPCTVARGDPSIDQGPHPFTRSLLERAARAGNAVDRSKVERVIRRRADLFGRSDPPVIKWLPDPQAAFDHLRRYRVTEAVPDGVGDPPCAEALTVGSWTGCSAESMVSQAAWN
jgi:hypothetical protein